MEAWEKQARTVVVLVYVYIFFLCGSIDDVIFSLLINLPCLFICCSPIAFVTVVIQLSLFLLLFDGGGGDGVYFS